MIFHPLSRSYIFFLAFPSPHIKERKRVIYVCGTVPGIVCVQKDQRNTQHTTRKTTKHKLVLSMTIRLVQMSVSHNPAMRVALENVPYQENERTRSVRGEGSIFVCELGGGWVKDE